MVGFALSVYADGGFLKMNENPQKPRLAVIGGGVAGIVAAYRLQDRFDITVLERNDYLGGHTHTIPVPDGPDQGTPVDTGFIVFNDRTYPLFKEFLTDLKVSWQDTTMSFSFFDEASGFHYAGNGLNGLFSQRINLINPFFWRMLLEIRRFSRLALAGVDNDSLAGQSLGEFLVHNRFSDYLCDRYVLPMGAAIWSTAPAEMLEFPAAALFHFWRNHGLLSLRDRPQWHTVEGGSHAYVQAFQKQFPGTIRLNAKVCEVRRSDAGVDIGFENGESENFDRVVIAAHADQAFAMLANPTEDEELLLKPWHYQKNRTVLHTDTSTLPPLERAWACWNYCREKGWEARNPVSVTYDMNLLQRLQTRATYCVSLNRQMPIAEDTVIADMNYDHPTYTTETMATQPKLPRLNETGPVYFCGSYFGYGFHEDAVRSATEMVGLVQ